MSAAYARGDRRIRFAVLLVTAAVGWWAGSALFRTPAIPPPDGFTVVASGWASGLHWTLSRKPGPDGATCWHLASRPPLKLLQSDTECLPRNDPRRSRSFATELPFGTDATGSHDVVVAVLSDRVKNAEFGFDDGSRSAPVYVDRASGVVVWAGPSRPFVTSVSITLADGLQLGCGPGDVTHASQLQGRTEVDLLDIRRFAWTCLDLD